MHRRALLAVAATVPLAGCPTPPWADDPETVDGADVTFRREHTDEFDPGDDGVHDAAVLDRALDEDPPRITVRGRLLAGARECYRVTLTETTLSDERLALRLTTEDDPDWDGGPCPDVGQAHPYEVVVAFASASVPQRVVVRHDDETVLDEPV